MANVTTEGERAAFTAGLFCGLLLVIMSGSILFGVASLGYLYAKRQAAMEQSK